MLRTHKQIELGNCFQQGVQDFGFTLYGLGSRDGLRFRLRGSGFGGTHLQDVWCYQHFTQQDIVHKQHCNNLALKVVWFR